MYSHFSYMKMSPEIWGRIPKESVKLRSVDEPSREGIYLSEKSSKNNSAFCHIPNKKDLYLSLFVRLTLKLILFRYICLQRRKCFLEFIL